MYKAGSRHMHMNVSQCARNLSYWQVMLLTSQDL